MLTLVSALLAEVGPSPSPGIYLDVNNLQWWQALGGLLVLLGVSPAPWITALATGRLLFRADLERQLIEKDKVHVDAMEVERRATAALLEECKAAYSITQQALDEERERNAKLTAALADSTAAMEVTNHALTEFNEIAKRANRDG